MQIFCLGCRVCIVLFSCVIIQFSLYQGDCPNRITTSIMTVQLLLLLLLLLLLFLFVYIKKLTITNFIIYYIYYNNILQLPSIV